MPRVHLRTLRWGSPAAFPVPGQLHLINRNRSLHAFRPLPPAAACWISVKPGFLIKSFIGGSFYKLPGRSGQCLTRTQSLSDHRMEQKFRFTLSWLCYQNPSGGVKWPDPRLRALEGCVAPASFTCPRACGGLHKAHCLKSDRIKVYESTLLYIKCVIWSKCSMTMQTLLF